MFEMEGTGRSGFWVSLESGFGFGGGKSDEAETGAGREDGVQGMLQRIKNGSTYL